MITDMATQKIVFKALRHGKIIHKTINVEHSFSEIPEEIVNGIHFPKTSVEDQVMEMLDNMDKRDWMVKYDWDIILDYYPKKSKAKKSINDEIMEFMDFSMPYINMYPTLKRPFEAVVSESVKILFGKGKTNVTKFKEVCNMINISYKTAYGVYDRILKILNDSETNGNCLPQNLEKHPQNLEKHE